MPSIFSYFTGANGDGSVTLFDNQQKANSTEYSDRLFQQDPKKYNTLCEKHFGNSGQVWSSRAPEDIQTFLRDFIADDNIVLCRIIQYENKSNGHPLWRFDYFRAK